MQRDIRNVQIEKCTGKFSTEGASELSKSHFFKGLFVKNRTLRIQKFRGRPNLYDSQRADGASRYLGYLLMCIVLKLWLIVYLSGVCVGIFLIPRNTVQGIW